MPARRRGPEKTVTREPSSHGEHGGDCAFHVERTATPDGSVSDLTSKGIEAPVLSDCRHHIEMPVDEHRWETRVGPGDAHDDACAPRCRLDDLRGVASGGKLGGNPVGGSTLATCIPAAEVGGVEADELRARLHGIGAEAVGRAEPKVVT